MSIEIIIWKWPEDHFHWQYFRCHFVFCQLLKMSDSWRNHTFDLISQTGLQNGSNCSRIMMIHLDSWLLNWFVCSGYSHRYSNGRLHYKQKRVADDILDIYLYFKKLNGKVLYCLSVLEQISCDAGKGDYI